MRINFFLGVLSSSRLLAALGCRAHRFACYLKTSFFSQSWRYRLQPDPFRTIWIDPRLIRWPNYKPVTKKNYRLTTVTGGNWDQKTKDFEDHELFVSMRLHFVDGLRWEETPYFKMALGSLQQGRPFWHQCRTMAQLTARCASVDRLFGEIQDNGFRPPVGIDRPLSGVARTCAPGEVKVGFGRSGAPVLITGRHRLSVAKILGFQLIPVQVAVRHPAWERIRANSRRQARRGIESEYLKHPDVEYLL